MNPDRSALMRLLGMLVVFGCWTALFALAVTGPGCHPQTPPAPLPEPDGPPADVDGGTPAATACGRAAQRALALRCTTDAVSFEDACSRYEALGGESSWRPEPCMVSAESCEQLSDCRGGQ